MRLRAQHVLTVVRFVGAGCRFDRLKARARRGAGDYRAQARSYNATSPVAAVYDRRNPFLSAVIDRRYSSACDRLGLWGAFITFVLSCGLSLRAAEPHREPAAVDRGRAHLARRRQRPGFANRDQRRVGRPRYRHPGGFSRPRRWPEHAGKLWGFEPPRLSIRGSGLQSAPSSRGVALLLDGLPLGLADGSFNSSLVDPATGAEDRNRSRPRRLREAPAVMGGALNLIGARGAASPPAAVHAEAGSFGALRAKCLRWLTQAEHLRQRRSFFSRQDGYRAHSGQERSAFFGSIRETGKPGAESTVSVYYARPDYDVPGPLTLTQAQNAPRSVSTDVLRDQPRRGVRGLGSWPRRHPPKLRICAVEGGIALAADRRFFFANSRPMASAFPRATISACAVRSPVVLPSPVAITAFVWPRRRPAAGATASASSRFQPGGRAVRSRRTVRHDGDARFGGRCFADAHADRDHMASRRYTRSATSSIACRPVRRHAYDAIARVAPTLPQASLRWFFDRTRCFSWEYRRRRKAPTFDDLMVVSGALSETDAGEASPLQIQRANDLGQGSAPAGAHGPLSWDITGLSRRLDQRNPARSPMPRAPRSAPSTPARPGTSAWKTTAPLASPRSRPATALNVADVGYHFYFENDSRVRPQPAGRAPPHVGATRVIVRASARAS